jgi:hypothetical protein
LNNADTQAKKDQSVIGDSMTYQSQGDAGSLGEIVRLSQDRALTLIRFYKTTRYRSEDELLSDDNFRLIRAVEKFDLGWIKTELTRPVRENPEFNSRVIARIPGGNWAEAKESRWSLKRAR